MPHFQGNTFHVIPRQLLGWLGGGGGGVFVGGIERADPLKGILLTWRARMRLHPRFVCHENIHVTRVVVVVSFAEELGTMFKY